MCEKALIIGEFFQCLEEIRIVLAGPAQGGSAELQHIGAGIFAVERRYEAGKNVGGLIGADAGAVAICALDITGCYYNRGFLPLRQDIVEGIVKRHHARGRCRVSRRETYFGQLLEKVAMRTTHETAKKILEHFIFGHLSQFPRVRNRDIDSLYMSKFHVCISGRSHQLFKSSPQERLRIERFEFSRLPILLQSITSRSGVLP